MRFSDVELGDVLWREEHGEFHPVRVVALAAPSVRVVTCDAVGDVPADILEADERGVHAADLHTYDGMRRLQARTQLYVPAEAVDAADGPHPDAPFAFDVLSALRDDDSDDQAHQGAANVLRRGVPATIARLAAQLAGWPADPTSWHDAVRVVPGRLAADAAAAGTDGHEDVVVVPQRILVALARDAARRDPELLDIVEERHDLFCRQRIAAGRSEPCPPPQLARWRADLHTQARAGAPDEPVAEVAVAIDLLTACGFAHLPTVRAALAHLTAAREALAAA